MSFYFGANRVADEGVLKVVTGTDPAAGVEITQTVPAGKAWELIAVRFTLVTDATAANRDVALLLDDGTTVFTKLNRPGSIIASKTYDLNFVTDFGFAGQENGLATSSTRPMPSGIILGPGYRVRTSTDSIQAGDNYGAPALYVAEYDVGD